MIDCRHPNAFYALRAKRKATLARKRVKRRQQAECLFLAIALSVLGPLFLLGSMHLGAALATLTN